MAQATTGTSSTSCIVSNSLAVPANPAQPQTGWNGDIVVINAYNSDPDGTQQGYEQTLELLPFMGGDTLAPSATDSITLDDVLNGVPMTVYDLIVAQADNLFPVQVVSEMLSSDDPPIYPKITVAASGNGADPFVSALQFYQTITAYPTSNLATGFTAALNAARSGSASSNGVDSTVNQFFQQYPAYQTVTLDAYVAVSTYVATFATAWAGFQDSFTYYLYTSAGKGTEAQACGKVTFLRNQPAGVPSVTDPDAGYTVTYFDGDGTPTPLTFSNGVLVSSTTDAVQTISLVPSYTPLSTFTGNSDDYGTIILTLNGTANGQQMVGVDQEQSGWQDFLNNLGTILANQYVQLSLALIGVAFSIKLLADGVRWLRNRFRSNEAANGGAPPTQAQVNQDRSDLSVAEINRQNGIVLELQNMNAGVRISAPADISADALALRGGLVESSNSIVVQNQTNIIGEQGGELGVLSQFSNNSDMSSAANTLRNTASQLQQIQPGNSGASGNLEAIADNLSQNQALIDKITAAVGSRLAGQAAKTLMQDKAVQTDLESQDKALEEESSMIKDGEISGNE
ncbi:hypothetical protein [Azospirillum lipoferum]|uniref:Uncharacterized protein n=1 Tax=Azospirillum lipoferum (strain 4B) TaxID=862719 RepID=G7ZD60_AZOL4|nr:hypothetical protein [Azospirillum lipoferum]CBS89322.1 exported protein of unknown function [Azospirillum lipoferum 4B]